MNSTGEGLAQGTAISLSQEDTEGALRERFRSALGKAFSNAASELSADAPVLAEFSVAQSDARDGIVAGEGTQTDSDESINWLSPPRRKRDFDKCAAQRLRASLILYDRASGEVLYRASGQAIECDFSDEDLAAMAEALVSSALSGA